MRRYTGTVSDLLNVIPPVVNWSMKISQASRDGADDCWDDDIILGDDSADTGIVKMSRTNNKKSGRDFMMKPL